MAKTAGRRAIRSGPYWKRFQYPVHRGSGQIGSLRGNQPDSLDIWRGYVEHQIDVYG